MAVSQPQRTHQEACQNGGRKEENQSYLKKKISDDQYCYVFQLRERERVCWGCRWGKATNCVGGNCSVNTINNIFC